MKIIITSIDNPFGKGGSGGKQTHIRLFAQALEKLAGDVAARVSIAALQNDDVIPLEMVG